MELNISQSNPANFLIATSDIESLSVEDVPTQEESVMGSSVDNLSVENYLSNFFSIDIECRN